MVPDAPRRALSVASSPPPFRSDSEEPEAERRRLDLAIASLSALAEDWELAGVPDRQGLAGSSALRVAKRPSSAVRAQRSMVVGEALAVRADSDSGHVTRRGA
jgi:hypothetical protein